MHAPGPEKSLVARAPRSTPLVAAIAACLACSAAAEECPQPLRATGTARPAPLQQSATPTRRYADRIRGRRLEATRDGEWLLQGDVLIKQGERTLKTRNAKYNAQEQSFSVDEDVEYCRPESQGQRQLGARRPGRRRDVRRCEVRAEGPQRARRGGPHPGHARQPAQAQRRALHDLPGRRGRLGAARQRYRHPAARRPRLRPRRAAGLQGRADSLHAVHLLSGRQPAQVGLPVSRRSAPPRAAARRCRCRGTGTSRRTTTRRSCRPSSPSAAASSTASSAT